MLGKIKSILKNKGYVLYTRPYELNIIGLRSKSTRPNKFDDEIHVFYKKENNKWNYHLFRATTDPGTFWLNNPSYPQGTAILHEGQYKDAYQIGLHNGQYKALIQTKPVAVMRDYDRNAILEFKNGRIEKGLFGINIHRAKSNGKTLIVDKFSAGCQVFQSADDFELFMILCEKHRSLYGNRFTYTLIDFRAVRRITLRTLAMLTSFLTSLIAGIFYTRTGKDNNKKKKQ